MTNGKPNAAALKIHLNEIDECMTLQNEESKQGLSSTKEPVRVIQSEAKATKNQNTPL